MYRSSQREFGGGNEFYSEPSTPPLNSRSMGQRKTSEDEVLPSEFSPGLLDLHSLDTELLPEVGLLVFCKEGSRLISIPL